MRLRGKGGSRSDGGVEQEHNSATGGNGGSANGGAGGNANSGNAVAGNGNALSFGQKHERSRSRAAAARRAGIDSGSKTEGGDTWVWSGDARGGNGGDASADGGDAAAGVAIVKQNRRYGGPSIS